MRLEALLIVSFWKTEDLGALNPQAFAIWVWGLWLGWWEAESWHSHSAPWEQETRFAKQVVFVHMKMFCKTGWQIAEAFGKKFRGRNRTHFKFLGCCNWNFNGRTKASHCGQTHHSESLISSKTALQCLTATFSASLSASLHSNTAQCARFHNRRVIDIVLNEDVSDHFHVLRLRKSLRDKACRLDVVRRCGELPGSELRIGNFKDLSRRKAYLIKAFAVVFIA